MESSLQRGMRWQFITSYMHRYIEYDTTMLCFINWFHRIRYTTTVFFCWCNCQSCRISSTPSNYEVYRASNLKFHVSIANLKKKESIYSTYESCRRNFVSQKPRLLCPSQQDFHDAACCCSFSLCFPLNALLLILFIRTARAAVLCEREWERAL